MKRGYKTRKWGLMVDYRSNTVRYLYLDQSNLVLQSTVYDNINNLILKLKPILILIPCTIELIVLTRHFKSPTKPRLARVCVWGTEGAEQALSSDEPKRELLLLSVGILPARYYIILQ